MNGTKTEGVLTVWGLNVSGVILETVQFEDKMLAKDLLKEPKINDERAQRLWIKKRDEILRQWEILGLECKELKRSYQWWQYPKRIKARKFIANRLARIKILLKEKKKLEKHWLES
jgi:hypothetical protein